MKLRGRFMIDSRGRRYRNTLLERTVLKAVTARARKMGAWVQGVRTERVNDLMWEFTYLGERPFFKWSGMASNSFDARLKGWEAWIVRAWIREHGSTAPFILGVFFYLQTFGVGGLFYGGCHG